MPCSRQPAPRSKKSVRSLGSVLVRARSIIDFPACAFDVKRPERYSPFHTIACPNTRLLPTLYRACNIASTIFVGLSDNNWPRLTPISELPCDALVMPGKKRSKTSNRSTPNKNINIPPISKSEAGAATGAVLGAVGGPMGAVLGGAVGAMVGKRAESGKPMMPAVKRTARQAAGAMKAAVKTARVAVPAAKRIVKSVRRRKTSSGPKKSGAKKSSRTKAGRRSTLQKMSATRAKKRSTVRKTRSPKGARGKKTRR